MQVADITVGWSGDGSILIMQPRARRVVGDVEDVILVALDDVPALLQAITTAAAEERKAEKS